MFPLTPFCKVLTLDFTEEVSYKSYFLYLKPAVKGNNYFSIPKKFPIVHGISYMQKHATIVLMRSFCLYYPYLYIYCMFN